MPLTALLLMDFQAHEHKLLKFAPGITTIVGPTDSGKSAIMRALRWACLNDLLGDAFIRDGAKEVVVELAFEDHRLVRIKGRHNTYELDKQEFSSIQRGVPDAIAKLLRTSELNFQSQHDSPFWFSESAPEVSRQLNAVVDLSVIDTALSNIASSVRHAADLRNVSQERLNELQLELEQIKHQQQRVDDFKALKACNETAKQTAENHDQLAGTLDRIRTGSNRLSSATQRLSQVVEVFEAAKSARDLARQCARLGEAIGYAGAYAQRSAPPADFASVEKAYGDWQRTTAITRELKQHISAIERKVQEALQADKLLANAERKLHERSKGRRCPLCQQTIS